MSQSLNLDGLLYSPYILIKGFVSKESEVIPHFSVKDITKINPEKLKSLGFEGLIFDKDNTLTKPYENELFSEIKTSFEHYQEIFKDKIVIMSNSAGTKDDKNKEDAKQIEQDLGIPVLRHSRKKPGGIYTVTKYFKCDSKDLVMFGDRIFTDIVFGNRYGMLTIHTSLITEKNDNKAASFFRKYESNLLNNWIKKGKIAPPHKKYDPAIRLEYRI